MRDRLTYANVMATIAAFVALGGASYAAVKLPKNSVGTKQLKRNAVTTAKVKNEAVTGEKIKLSTLGTVPNATNATHANDADSATNAVHATTAQQPLAFAHVTSTGQIDQSNSQHVSVTMSEIPEWVSTYCFSGLPFKPSGGQVTLVESESTYNDGASLDLGPIIGCPPNTEATVFTWKGLGAQPAGFYIMFYG